MPPARGVVIVVETLVVWRWIHRVTSMPASLCIHTLCQPSNLTCATTTMTIPAAHRPRIVPFAFRIGHQAPIPTVCAGVAQTTPRATDDGDIAAAMQRLRVSFNVSVSGKTDDGGVGGGIGDIAGKEESKCQRGSTADSAPSFGASRRMSSMNSTLVVSESVMTGAAAAVTTRRLDVCVS